MIEIYTEANKRVFDEYVSNHNESMFFHSSNYINFLAQLLSASVKHLIAFDNNKVVGVLPLLKKDGPWGKVYNSLPYYGSNGGVLADNNDVANELINAYNSLILEKEVLASVWVENLLATNNYSNKIKHNLTDYRIGQYTNIQCEVKHAEELMNLFHYKTRNMIRKGERSGFEIKVNNEEVYFLRSVHKENMTAIGGKAKSDSFFNFPNHFEKDKDYKIWVAYLNDAPVAALLLFYYRKTVEYYTPVIKEEYRDKQPLSLLIYEAMKHALNNGYTLWNWGGTWATQGGVYTFKKRWGTIDKNYNYYIQLNDEKLYEKSKDEILKYYPDFFIVP